MAVPFSLIDAFVVPNLPFSGNPASVVLLEEWWDEDILQNVAAKFKQAETAFLVPLKPGEFELRWFTPTVEVDLCGHATLGATHFLVEQGLVEEEVVFHTRSGPLACRAQEGAITLGFPNEKPVSADLPSLAAFEGLNLVWTGENRMDWFVVLETLEDVKGFQPDFAKLAELGKRGVIVTAKTGEAVKAIHFVSRFFAPAAGVDEDAVTGSAHCALAPYWSEILGSDSLMGYQMSRESGLVACEIHVDRVLLTGQAKSWGSGSLSV